MPSDSKIPRAAAWGERSLGTRGEVAYISRMRLRLMIAAVVLAIGNTCVEALGLRAVAYGLKPLATLVLLALVLRTGGASRYRTWIAAGLCASLAGDILLMLPHGLFVQGLAAFLLAHICYITAFVADGGGRRASPLSALPVYAFSLAVLAYLWPSLGAMRLPVACYVAVISTMAWQAIARWRVRLSLGSALAAAGSMLFLTSDFALAIRKFVAPFPGATVVILATYYLAQWGIALSVSEDAAV